MAAAAMLITLWPVLPPASADSVLTSIPVGSPSAVAVNATSNQIYVTNADSGPLTVIDGATNTVSRVIPVGSDPVSVAFDSATGEIYVACYATDNIVAIDVVNQAINSISLGFSPLSVAVDQTTDQVYAVGDGSDSVAVIDGTTYTVSAIKTNSTLKSLAVDEATNKVYVVTDDTVTALDVTSGLSSILYSGAAPVAVAVNPDTDRIYAVDLGNDSVAVINDLGNVSTVAAGTDPVAAAVDPATNMIYAADNGSDDVTVIDGATDMPTSIGVGAHPVGVAVNPATDMIYVACEGGNEVTVIAGSAAVLPATNTVPANPSTAAGTPATQTVVSLTVGQAGYTVNGAVYILDAPPLIYDGRTLVPIRDVATALGATVSWDAAAQKVTVAVGGKTIELWIGQGTAKINGTTVPIDSGNPDVTPILAPSGRVMLPLRFISENLGCQVDWNPSLQEIKLTYTKP